MRWRKIEKDIASMPKEGVCTDWRDQLRNEGGEQCVYCTIGENQLGGMRGFHIEHYRPKSKFPTLRDEYTNLFYACCICNVFKGDNWPGNPVPALDTPAYPSPSETDYNDHFNVDWSTGFAWGKHVAAKYVISRLHLNRPQLMRERRAFALVTRLCNLYDWAVAVAEGSQLNELEDCETLLKELATVLAKIGRTRESFLRARPYDREDLRNSY